METTIPKDKERRRTPRGALKVFRDLLFGTLRFIARHVTGFYSGIAAFLTVGFVVGLAAAAVFFGFASIVAEGLTQGVDNSTLEWFARHRTPAMSAFMSEATTLGNGLVLTVLVLVVCVFLWQTRHRWSVYILLIGVFGGQILNDLLKQAFDRARPSVVESLLETHSFSFPSGHAMVSLIVYGSVAYLVARLEPTPMLRRTTWTLAILIILLVGISRLYLGVHYPSDVVAGFLAGTAWLAFVASGVAAVRFFAPRHPSIETEEQGLNVEDERAAGVRD